MKQLIVDFTRITVTSRTTVDLVFTNNNTLTVAVSKNNVVVDHKMLIISKKIVYRVYRRKRVIDRSQLTAANFQQSIAPRIENIVVSDDVQQRAKCLTDTVDASACELVSDKMVTIAYQKRWFNDDLKRLRRERNVAETKA